MNITKALKEKKRLTNKANAEYDKFRNYNVTRSDSVSPYNALEAYNEWIRLTDELISLKSKIHSANSKVYDKIFRLSELKSAISKMRMVNTTERKEVNSAGEAILITPMIGVIERDNIIEKMENELIRIQEELEAHNAVTNI